MIEWPLNFPWIYVRIWFEQIDKSRQYVLHILKKVSRNKKIFKLWSLYTICEKFLQLFKAKQKLSCYTYLRLMKFKISLGMFVRISRNIKMCEENKVLIRKVDDRRLLQKCGSQFLRDFWSQKCLNLSNLFTF